MIQEQQEHLEYRDDELANVEKQFCMIPTTVPQDSLDLLRQFKVNIKLYNTFFCLKLTNSLFLFFCIHTSAWNGPERCPVRNISLCFRSGWSKLVFKRSGW